MNYSGVAIFVVFFGLTMLEAFRGGNWMRAAFWIVIGLAFWSMDRSRRARRDPLGAGKTGE